MERACRHGYHECQRCVDEADERARKVAEHYASDLKRDRVRRNARPGHSMYHHPEDCPPGGKALKYKPSLTVKLKREDGGLPSGYHYYDVKGKELRRCDCGSRLLAPEALETGVCHYCRTGAKRPWDSRCKCGSGLMGKQSIATGKCSECRLDEHLEGLDKQLSAEDWQDE